MEIPNFKIHSVWKLPEKSHFCERSEQSKFPKKTFGFTFLPLINSFEFLQILVRYLVFTVSKESPRIKKNFQGAKTNHQRFPKWSTRNNEIDNFFKGIFKHREAKFQSSIIIPAIKRGLSRVLGTWSEYLTLLMHIGMLLRSYTRDLFALLYW